ncbi:MAG: carboxypeptidase regulatory-like domain-containing protein [Janthinobacterium lividum]
MKKQLVRLALAAVTVAAPPAILSPSVFAQAISVNGGSIQGTITDPSGAAVSGAAISITSPDTGFKRDLAADKAGFYSVGPLNPGNYAVSVTAPGFQTLTVQTVIRTGTATPGSFKLSVGSSSTEISVEAGAVQVNTEQGGVSDVITKEQINSLPINGRNFLDVAQIEPGVILQSGESFDPTKAGYSAISVSGVSGRTTRILLDGQDITDENVGTTIFNVSQGAINEFQLNRSTQDVSGEVTSTGQVLVSTNSGTNGFHGQLFYNFQDYRALFASGGASNPPFQRNQFGGSIGGPIIKDKLFFFGNAERIKQDSSTQVTLGPTLAAIQAAHPNFGTPYRETYSTVRLDYNGPVSGHYFARINYNVNSVVGNFGSNYELYANRDNTPGIAGGADFAKGHFTHSFRGSYEKFHNLIGDSSATSGYVPLPGIAFQNTTYGLYTGPNVNAPQGTFQSDKQFRYDGTWTAGKQNLKYGYSLNRIQGGGFASFFGLAPRVRETSGTLLPGANPGDILNGYHASSIYVGNGQGYFTENGGFGLPAGGTADWRQGAYVSDSIKLTPSFTLTAGVRWSVDTGRANQDLATPLCGDVVASNFTAGYSPCQGQAASTPLFSLVNPNLGQRVHQSYGNFAPQVGFAYSPGDHKTVLRAAVGIFFENDVFNNTTNARTTLLKTGAFNDFESVCSAGTLNFPDGSSHGSATVGGVTQTITQMCSVSIAQAAPFIRQLQADFQANTAANAISTNGSFVGATGQFTGVYGAPYRTPYAEQFNFGIQREVFKGAVLSADYVHNASLKIGQSYDQNHVGAARYFNATAARAAIASANAGVGCGPTDVACGIGQGLQIQDYAMAGLDSGNERFAGKPAARVSVTNADQSITRLNPNTGAAFPGINPLIGNATFIMPVGKSGYDALQMVFRQVASHPLPGIVSSNLQISYALSRIVSTNMGGSTGSSDAYFSGLSWDNDNPGGVIGRASLDHKHEVNFGGSMHVKYGLQLGIIGHFYSAPPTSLTLDTGSVIQNGNIFQSDINGDGTTGDLLPGTLPGDYMHRVKNNTLQNAISGFNQSFAGKVTPAGQALLNAGLMTQAQLNALGGVIQPIANLGSTRAINNPTFRSMDVNASYPIPLTRFHEGVSLEPTIAFYNVGNFGNYTSLPGTLLNTTNAGGTFNTTESTIAGPNNFAVQNGQRQVRGSGTFSQGAPRVAEFQLKLNF